MTRLREQNGIDLVINSDRIRNSLITAAIQVPEYLPELFACADLLLHRHRYRWPSLYTTIMHSLLERRAFEDAIQMHLRLSHEFLPEHRMLGVFLAHFVIEPDISMQQTLETIYWSLSRHEFYDVIIPRLFNSGQSNLARHWRDILVQKSDLPSSETSGPFLRFLTSYYTAIQLNPEELAIIRPMSTASDMKGGSKTSQLAPSFDANNKPDPVEATNKDMSTPQKSAALTDSMIAKLFASNWTPIEFAIRLARNMGIITIGSRALQALALRENKAEDVNKLLKYLKTIGISIPTDAHAKSISRFARDGDNILLHDLLCSDIHPEEFDDEETRQMILHDSIMRGDTQQERLMRGVMRAISPELSRFSQVTEPRSTKPAFPLEMILLEEPWRMKLEMDRLLSLDFQIEQADASAILRKAFAAFPVDSTGIKWHAPRCSGILEAVIGVVRSIATQDVAIPAEYWKVLLLGLAHQGRIDTLEQLSFEIVHMYDTSFVGLYQVHEADLPRQSTVQAKKLLEDSLQDDEGRSPVIGYIPADLPLLHPNHPVFKIFDSQMQRTIVRQGMYSALSISSRSVNKAIDRNTIVSEYNVACGIRILAKLRDQGVLVHHTVVESAANKSLRWVRRMKELGRDPGCREWLRTRRMRDLINTAWGSTLVSKTMENPSKRWTALPSDHDQKLLASGMGA